MEWYDLLEDSYARVPEVLERVLEGLTEDDLNWQPRSDCNSIGWLVWHLTRQQDAQIASLMGGTQAWIEDGWHKKFNRPPDPHDMGFGHTPEDVAAFKSPDIQTFLDYNRAVMEYSKRYFCSLTQSDLDRTLDEPWFQPPPTVGVRLVSIMNDAVLHAGQAAYIRGLRHGKGWQKY
ncbi:MAG: DinB family protein [Thermodesulfobacteriota bacterium]|nr:DinB family protein [Thermodesulfobacteriota bacterium]